MDDHDLKLVIEWCDIQREIKEGVGLSDDLINIIEYAYKEGFKAGVSNLED
jgi:hypothetical protein